MSTVIEVMTFDRPKPGERVMVAAFMTVGTNPNGYHCQRACRNCTLGLEKRGMVRRVDERPVPGDAPFTCVMVRFELVPPYTLEHCNAMVDCKGHDGWIVDDDDD